MNPTFKALILLPAGVGAFFGATQWSAKGADDVESAPEIVAAVTRSSPGVSAPTGGSSAGASADNFLAALSSRRGFSEATTAFAPLSWQRPAPPPPAPATAPPPQPAPQPEPPTAPPLPFTFVGMAERGVDRPQAFLAKGEALLVVAVGDIVENQRYRIDALSPTGVVVTYLPLNKQQTINVPGGSP
jgi:hypothetical protein